MPRMLRERRRNQTPAAPAEARRRGGDRAGRVCPHPADPGPPSVLHARFRQGLQLLDRRDAPRERGRALGGRQQESGRRVAPAVHPPGSHHGRAQERRHCVAAQSGSGLHQLPEWHGERRRSGAGHGERDVSLAAGHQRAHRHCSDNDHRLFPHASRGPADELRGGVLVMVSLSGTRDGERGAALVLVALWLPVLFGFMVFVADVGNWFVHKRHLQMQADAGALAGGGLFTVPCSDAPIEAESRKYAGDPSSGSPYNLQVAPTDQANVHVLLNSTVYWNEGGTNYSDGGPPCSARFVDMKITEATLPWFFGLGVVRAINANARVEIQALNRARGALPVAV